MSSKRIENENGNIKNRWVGVGGFGLFFYVLDELINNIHVGCWGKKRGVSLLNTEWYKPLERYGTVVLILPRALLVSSSRHSPTTSHLPRTLVPPVMVRAGPLVGVFALPCDLGGPLVCWACDVAAASSSPSAASPTSSSSSRFGSTSPSPNILWVPGIGILGCRVRFTGAVRRAGQLGLGAGWSGESRLESAQTPRIPPQHDGPALDRLIRHAGLEPQGDSRGSSACAGVAIKGRRGRLKSAEQRFVGAIAIMPIGVDIVARARPNGIDGPADVGGIIGVIALIRVGIEGGKCREDRCLGAGSGALGQGGLRGERTALP